MHTGCCACPEEEVSEFLHHSPDALLNGAGQGAVASPLDTQVGKAGCCRGLGPWASGGHAACLLHTRHSSTSRTLRTWGGFPAKDPARRLSPGSCTVSSSNS